MVSEQRSFRWSRENPSSYCLGQQTSVRSWRLRATESDAWESERTHSMPFSIRDDPFSFRRWAIRRFNSVSEVCFARRSFESLVLLSSFNGAHFLFTERLAMTARVFPRFAQNLVFYGVSQNTGKSLFFSSVSLCLLGLFLIRSIGAWQFDPYLSFVLSTLVELFAYIVVHLILDRLGRKGPYCTFAIAFGLLALSVLPVQSLLAHNPASECDREDRHRSSSRFSKCNARCSWSSIFCSSFSRRLRLQRSICSRLSCFPRICARPVLESAPWSDGWERFSALSPMTIWWVCLIGKELSECLLFFEARISIGLPVTLCGIVSLFAGIVASIFPETLNKPLPQTVEDVEDLGLQL